MKQNRKPSFSLPLCLLIAFVLWTGAVRLIDVQPIGPCGSSVGLATLNRFVHELTGVHFTLYHITDWLGLVPFAVCAGFAVLGLVQWVLRNHITRVDRDILVLGGLYTFTVGAYLLFETVVINYRPVLIDGCLEVSYPSSTTLLVLCVMPSAAMQLNARIQRRPWRYAAVSAIWLFTAFMVIGRLVSGVHWFSDIVGGVLLSAALMTLYAACLTKKA